MGPRELQFLLPVASVQQRNQQIYTFDSQFFLCSAEPPMLMLITPDFEVDCLGGGCRAIWQPVAMQFLDFVDFQNAWAVNYSDMLSCVFMFLSLVMMLAWIHFQYPHMVISHLLIIRRNMRSSIYILRWIPDLPEQRDQNISGALRCYAINAWELLSERLINRIVNWPADLPLGPSASIWPDLIGGVTLMSSVMSHILTHLRPPLQATVPTVWCLGFNSVWDGDK